MDKILKVAKRLKSFTLEDIVMFTDFDIKIIKEFLDKSENIIVLRSKFEYVESVRREDKFKVIDKNISLKNSDITVINACEEFLRIKYKTLKPMSYQTYKTFTYAQIIPYFKKFQLKDITVQDIQKFKKYMKENKVSERRIKNILCLLNQIIKYFQNEGYINKTCVFEVKRVANIPKRQIQALYPEQLAQLFKITGKKYPYLTPIIQNIITLKQPLNNILTGSEKADGRNVSPVSEQIEPTARMCKRRNSVSRKFFQDNEQQKKSLKRKIRKDFYKIKQEMGLSNYVFDDLRFCQKCVD